MEYRIRVKMNGTRNNQPVSETHSVIGGSMWFIDDNLKTMSLVGGIRDPVCGYVVIVPGA